MPSGRCHSEVVMSDLGSSTSAAVDTFPAAYADNAKTLLDKVWDAHVVRSVAGEPDLLYVDLHLIHEATSPQAFEALRLAGRRVRRPELTIATTDHTTPTIGGIQGPDALGRKLPGPFPENCTRETG